MNPSDKPRHSKSPLQKVGENPVGKVLIITISTLGVISFAGALFQILALSVNGYKDFKGALKR